MPHAKKVNHIVIPTSTQYNNCGLHIIVPHLLPFIRNIDAIDATLPALGEAVASLGECKRFKGTKGYRYFLEAFAEYYQIPSTNGLFANIANLLDHYTHPQDMEVLFGPVLRVMLKKVLLNSQEHKDSLKASFQVIVNKCRDQYRQQFPRMRSKRHLQNWLANLVWQREDEHEELFIPNKSIIGDAIFQNKSSDITSCWDSAYLNYCNYQSDPTQGVYVSESQIALLCASLKFEFKYVLSNGRLSESGIAIDRPLATVVAKNASRIHWEVVASKRTSWQVEKENSTADFQSYHFISIALPLKQGKTAKSSAELQNRFRDKIKQLVIADIPPQEEGYSLLEKKQRFIKALKENNIDLLVTLAKRSFKTKFDSVKDKQGNHILHVIASCGSEENLAEVLKIKPGVARLINLPNRKGDTPLHTAFESKNVKLVKALIANHALVAKPNLKGDTPLHIAAAQTDNCIVEQLCLAGYAQNRESTDSKVIFDVLAKNKQNKTAKCLTKTSAIKQILTKQEAERPFQQGIALIYQGRYISLKNLIRRNPALLASVDVNGDTLLHHAFMAYKQTGQSCLLPLLNEKPNVNIKNKEGLTPLLLAVTLGVWTVTHDDTKHLMILYLKKLGANLTEADPRGFTALHYAALQNDPEAIDLLVSSGVYVDRVTAKGLAPIHIAAFNGNKRAFDALLRRGSDIDIVAYPHALPQLLGQPVQTKQEITPLWLALNSITTDIANAIFDHYIAKKNTDALPGLRCMDGSTLLHFFAYTKDFDRFKQALRFGVDPFVKNDMNYLPFHTACETGAFPIVKHYVEVLGPQQSYWSQLKRHSFDINDLPETGVNALSLAGERNEVVRYLARHGAIRVPATAERRQSAINRLYNFWDSQSQFRSQLESTTMNQVLTFGRIIGCTMLSYSSPLGMGVVAAHQALLYGMPTIKSKSSDLYYYVKPKVHNNAPTFVERGLDVTATATSIATDGVFAALNLADIVANPSRRAAGFAASMGMANIAGKFTDNLQLQGAAYFLGRELGMFAVEAYQNYGRAPSDAAIDYELSKAFDLWTSLLGKDKGEWCVTWMHQFSHMHRTMLESVGWFEHTVLSYMGTNIETIRGAAAAVGLQALDESISSALSMVSFYPQAAYSMMQSVSREVFRRREQVLANIEHQIAENLLPDSEHRDVTLQYLILNQTILLSQKLLEKKTEQATQDNKIKALEEEHDVLELSAIEEKAHLKTKIENAKNELQTITEESDALAVQVSESQNAYNTIWEKTPKGACEHKHRDARQNLLNGKIRLEDLKLKLQFFEDHNVDQEEIAEIQIQLQEAQTALVNFENELATTEREWLELANPVEKERLPKQNAEIEKHIAEQIAAFKNEQGTVYLQLNNLLISQDELADVWVSLRNMEQQVRNAKADFDVIDLRIKAIDSPPPINSRTIVDNALDQYPTDCDEVVKLILNAIVATGMISYADAEARIQNSLQIAFNSDHRKNVRLNRVLSHHLNQLRQDYRASLVHQRIELQNENDKALSALKEACENYEAQKTIVQQSKTAYEATIGGESADRHMIDQIFNQPHNWDAQNNGDNIKTTLTLMGQSNMTLGAMTDLGGPTSQWHLASSLAKSLVDYKYLFLTAPNIDVRLQEIDALATDLAKQTLDSNQIAILKQNWDLEIAQQLLNNSNTLAPALRASSISNHLQNGFRHGEGQSFIFENEDTSLTQMLASQFEAQDDASATQEIANVLQNQTNAISIAEAGVYVSPTVTPHVPSKPHGLNRWWDNAKEIVEHYGKKILKTTGGVSASIGSNGISAGFTYGNQFNVIQFNAPKPPPLFTFPEKGQSIDAVVSTAGTVNSQSVSGSSSVPNAVQGIKDIPHVVVMPWEAESALPLQPLIFSPQTQAVAQSNGVMTRSQVKQWEAQQASTATHQSNTALPPQSIAQSSSTQLALDNPFLQGILVEQLAELLNTKKGEIDRSDKVKTNDHRYNTRQKARERQEILDEFLAKPWVKEISAEMGGLGAIPLHGSSTTQTSTVTESANHVVIEQLLKLLGIGIAEAMPEAVGVMGSVPVEGAAINNTKIVTISGELNEQISQIWSAFQISLAHQLGHGIIGGDLTRKQREITELQQPYSGVDPDDMPNDLDSTSLPVVSSQGSKTESLVNQPGVSISSYTTPLLITHIFDLMYRRDDTSSKIGIYDHDYQKHKPRARGEGARHKGASVNPIPNAELGQRLLDSSYVLPNNPKERFNYYDKKIIKFRSSNDGKWHAYEVKKNVVNEVGNEILNQFENDNLITEKKRKKLIKL